MNDRQKTTIQPELPNIVGLSHICIFVDDMEQAVDYYRDLLGVEPDHCLSHWKNEGFFKAGGFVDEAADGDVSIAFVDLPIWMKYNENNDKSEIYRGKLIGN